MAYFFGAVFYDNCQQTPCSFEQTTIAGSFAWLNSIKQEIFSLNVLYEHSNFFPNP